jgi:hypothetical protein
MIALFLTYHAFRAQQMCCIQASQPGDAFFLPAAPVNQSFNVIAAATLKYRGQSRTLLRDATTREAPPFVLEKP